MRGAARQVGTAVAVALLAGCGSRGEEGLLTPAAARAGSFALAFGPPSAFVEIPDAPSLDLGATWTLEAWIRPADPSASFQHVLSKWNGAGDASYTLEVNGGRLRVAVHDGVHASQAEESRGTLVADQWQHVAASYDRGMLRLYIKGRLDREVPGVLQPMNSTRPLSIGHEGPPFNGWQYSGEIDEVRVWGVWRSGREIGRDMGRRLTGRERGLVGYWGFEEGEGQVARDLSRMGNDGRLGASEAADGSDPTWVAGVVP